MNTYGFQGRLIKRSCGGPGAPGAALCDHNDQEKKAGWASLFTSRRYLRFINKIDALLLAFDREGDDRRMPILESSNYACILMRSIAVVLNRMK